MDLDLEAIVSFHVLMLRLLCLPLSTAEAKVQHGFRSKGFLSWPCVQAEILCCIFQSCPGQGCSDVGTVTISRLLGQAADDRQIVFVCLVQVSFLNNNTWSVLYFVIVSMAIYKCQYIHMVTLYSFCDFVLKLCKCLLENVCKCWLK